MENSGIKITAEVLFEKLFFMNLLNFTTGFLHLAVWNDYGSQGNLDLLHSLQMISMWLKEVAT